MLFADSQLAPGKEKLELRTVLGSDFVKVGRLGFSHLVQDVLAVFDACTVEASAFLVSAGIFVAHFESWKVLGCGRNVGLV